MKIKHIGKHASRLKQNQNNSREAAFAEEWLREQEEGHLLASLMNEQITERDAMVAATVIQWLGSNVGMSFLENVIIREPNIQKWLRMRAMPTAK